MCVCIIYLFIYIQAWARNKNRVDKTDAEWQAARAATQNPNLDNITAKLEQMEYAVTPDGRCEAALSHLTNWSTWAGKGSYGTKTNFGWLWYAQRLLPRYMQACQLWASEVKEGTHRRAASLWSRKAKHKMLKTYVMRKKNSLGQENIYGLPFYCSNAGIATVKIFQKLQEFYNPSWGCNNAPTVVIASSIVFGGNVAALLQWIRERSAPSVIVDDVFNRALTSFGTIGPRTCHPFAYTFDIVDAVFKGVRDTPGVTAPNGMQQATFLIRDATNPDVTTKATLNNSRKLPSNLRQGDVLRLEVVKSSPRHAVVQVPPYIDFLVPSTTSKSVAIINVNILGFIDKTTSKFRVRPHAHEFVLMISRKYHLATVSTSRGMTIRSTMFGLY